MTKKPSPGAPIRREATGSASGRAALVIAQSGRDIKERPPIEYDEATIRAVVDRTLRADLPIKCPADELHVSPAWLRRVYPPAERPRRASRPKKLRK